MPEHVSNLPRNQFCIYNSFFLFCTCTNQSESFKVEDNYKVYVCFTNKTPRSSTVMKTKMTLLHKYLSASVSDEFSWDKEGQREMLRNVIW